jgi:hypothetical protein
MGALNWANVFHVRCSFLADPADVADQVQHAYTEGGSFTSIQSTQCVYDRLVITPLDGSSLSTELDASEFDNSSGDTEGLMVPPQAALVVTVRTAVRGRSGRGRMYIPGLRDTYLDVPPTTWTNPSNIVQGAATTFRTALAGSTDIEALVVASYLHSTAHDATVTQAQLGYIGTIRKRTT